MCQLTKMRMKCIHFTCKHSGGFGSAHTLYRGLFGDTVMVIPIMVKTLLLSNIIDRKSHLNLHKAVMVVKYYPPLCPLLVSCVYFRLHSAEEQLLALD